MQDLSTNQMIAAGVIAVVAWIYRANIIPVVKKAIGGISAPTAPVPATPASPSTAALESRIAAFVQLRASCESALCFDAVKALDREVMPHLMHTVADHTPEAPA